MSARKALPADFQAMDIRTSFIDRLPLSHRRFEWYIPFYGFAMEQFDLREYDVMAWDFALNFARDNGLQVVEACLLPE